MDTDDLLSLPYYENDYEYVNPWRFYTVHPYPVTLLIVNVVIIFMNLFANICGIYFICGQKKARTTHNMTIVSIAIVDVLISAFLLPLHLVSSVNIEPRYDELTPVLCKINRYLSFWFKTVILYTTLGMAINRYFKLTDSRAHNFLTGRCMFYLSFIWFSAAAYNIWKIMLNDTRLILIYPQDDRNLTLKRCSLSDFFQKTRIGFLVTDFLLIFSVPFAVFAYLFIHIAYQLCSTTVTPREKDAPKGRIMMSFLYFILFFICQLPYQILEVYVDYAAEITQRDVAWLQSLETLSYSQGLLNMAAFAACSEEVHRAWRTPEDIQRRRRRRTSTATVNDDTRENVTRVLLTTSSTDNVETICLT